MSTNTRFLILSDTHADDWNPPTTPVDVAIHCGDLTEESKLGEFRHALQMLQQIDAPLKLVIAGNHDWTLDTPKYQKQAAARADDVDEASLQKEWGRYGEARELLTAAASEGITFLEEGSHLFTLNNGAQLKVYASPYTCSEHAQGGFQFKPDFGHKFDIHDDAHVVITHSPPRGVLDRTDDRTNAGYRQLFEAVARARPRLHCFGHIHEAWGAKLVTWRGMAPGQAPSALTAIDGGHSRVIESLATLHPTKFDTDETRAEKADKLKACNEQNYCKVDGVDPQSGMQTLFVNAAIEGRRDGEFQVPWIVNIGLPTAANTDAEASVVADAPAVTVTRSSVVVSKFGQSQKTTAIPSKSRKRPAPSEEPELESVKDERRHKRFLRHPYHSTTSGPSAQIAPTTCPTCLSCRQ